MVFQQNCEKRYRDELANELERVRKIERNQIRIEEAQRCRLDLANRQLEFNKLVSDKEEKLRRKQAAALERLEAEP